VDVALGIDTGGTYTDAVLVDSRTTEVLSTAKSLTTKEDLSIGIKAAISAVLNTRRNSFAAESIGLVALSTTLATNAIAEGHGAAVCLLLIGYDRELIHQYSFQHELGTSDIVYLNGGHDIYGKEAAPLDEKAARQAILQRREQVGAFAVSGFFGAVNPAHELRLRALIQKLCDLPVTCGHELCVRLNSIRRATTAALNARLIPLIQDLVTSVRFSLDELSIQAPLMVVKGDGSLVLSEWAMQRPIETVLSGPAASAVGAFKLAAEQNVWAVDVGGTTSDIVELNGGRPKLNPEGANIGGWQTMVEAVDVHTIGLGGDSHVRCNAEKKLKIGPQRVMPLCKLAHDYPQVLVELQRQVRTNPRQDESAQFIVAGRKNRHPLGDKEEAILNRLETGPRPLSVPAGKIFHHDPWAPRRIQHLEELGLVQRAGFTPTDALHVLNRFVCWNPEASRLGAEILSAQLGLPLKDFCNQVTQTVSKQLAMSVISKVIENDNIAPDWEKEPTAKLLIDTALGVTRKKQLACKMTLRRPLVALGAPVEAYMPAVADRLHTQLIIPPHAEVANAIGAVSGGVIQRLRVHIRPLDTGSALRLYLSDGPEDFSDLEEAVSRARERMLPRVNQLARQAGAEQVEIRMDRSDKRAKVRGHEDLYLGTELVFTAYGRPSMAHRTKGF
jgi:N-methylhydantoinase A/oxoprolinase/acetone carboxylase beta subunit